MDKTPSLVIRVTWRKKFQIKNTLKKTKKKKKTKDRSLPLLLILNCLASLGHGEEDIVHWQDPCLVSGT